MRVLILLFSLLFVSVNGATITAPSCSEQDVSNAVWSASIGDTVRVPAGTANWTNSIVISNCISLIGAGIGNTVITAWVTNAYRGVISIIPNTNSISSNQLFRVSGFTIDANYKCNGILVSQYTTNVINKVRLDHNHIKNAGGTSAGRGVYITGSIFGVADNNTIENYLHGMDCEGYSTSQWSTLSIDIGSSNNFYFEDNILTTTNANVFHAGGHGGRYVCRYNSMTNTLDANIFPVWDMHGNQPTDLAAMMVCEIYGNNVDLGRGGRVFDQRGGTLMAFGNKIKYAADWGGIVIREEYLDSNYPAGNVYVMHVTNSYYWLIMRNGVARTTFDDITSNQYEDTYDLAQNTDFWIQNTNYNGTTEPGVYVGTTLPATCTVGDGAWITTQSTTDLTGMVGKNPTTPISGTFYKCTAPNVWTAFYTPYTYPHPLTIETTTTTYPPQRRRWKN